MPPSESEILAARLSRMRNLIDSLEQACSESAEQHELFRKLKREIEETRAALRTVPPLGFD